MNYYNEIKTQIINNEVTKRIKDYSKNRSDLNTYYNVGKLISEAGKHYGQDIIGQYSQKLMNDVNKKYNKKLLFKMRQLYILLSTEKVAPLVRQLSWSHCLMLLPIKNIDKINYYVIQTHKQNLSKRELENRIKSNEYERLDNKTKNKLINKEQPIISDFIKNPIIIKNRNNYSEITEKLLKQLILEDIDNFLLELGEGFCYIKSEYKIKLGDRYNYIDLLLYSIKFKCYVVLELKVTELKSEYIGQIKKYMNYIDKNIKSFDEDNTIGIIICKKDNKFVMEYCSDDRVFRTTYLLN